MPFDPSQPFDVISQPRITRGSTFGDQVGPGSDPGDNGQFAYGGSSVNDPEDYAALPAGSGVPPGYKFPVLNPKTGDVVWVTHRDKGPAQWTGRGVDLAPSAMQKLGAQTDDPLVVDTAKAVPPFDPNKPFDLIPKNADRSILSPTLSQEVGPPSPPAQATDARTQHLIDSSRVGSQRDLEDIAASLPGYQQSQEAASQYDTRDKLTAAIGNNLTPIVMHPLDTAISMLPTKENTYAPMRQMFTNPAKAFSRDVPIGSQEWYNELVSNLGMLATLKAPDLLKPREITNASGEPSTTGVPVQPLREGVGTETPLRQQGEAAPVQEQVPGSTDVSGTPQPPIGVAQEPEPVMVPIQYHYKQTQLPLTERDFRPNEDTAAGQPDTTSAQPVSVAGAEAPGISETRGQPAGTSNRQNIETYGENAVPSGTGADTGELLDNARADIRSGAVDPYAVLSQTRTRGIANEGEYATLAAEHERLVNDAVAKEKAGDPTAPEAAQAANDFANAIQPHKTAASNLFRLMQGDLNYDMSTPFGIDQYMKAELGRGMKPSERPMFEKQAADIRQGEADVSQAVARSDARVQRQYRNVADIPMAEAAARVKQLLNPCIVA